MCLEELSLYPSSPVTEVVLAARSPKIKFVAVPATCAAVNPALSDFSGSAAVSAICIPLFTASAILLVVLFDTFTPREKSEFVFSVTSVYFVVSICLAVILKSPPVVKSAPPISTVPLELSSFPEVIFKFPPVETFPFDQVVLFSLEFFTDTPTVVCADVKESM